MEVQKCLYCKKSKLTTVTSRLDGNDILRCENCGLMMVSNLSNDTEKLYTADYFEKEKGTKNGYVDYLSSPAANLIGKFAFSKLFLDKPSSSLDIGCADGSLVEILKSEGIYARGLEISKDAVAIARAKELDVSFSNLKKFPKETPKSDLVTAFDLLEHVDAPGDVLRSVYDNLKDNGVFCFSTLLVRKNDPTDYWFNNSLEHYIYYNIENLSFILTEIFGKNNFELIEIEINGIAEIWGFAKKGDILNEKIIMSRINNSLFDKSNPQEAYLLSLLYNQLSRFDTSFDIINYFEKVWPKGMLVQARFYNNFYQGKLELAVSDAKKASHILPANSVYWQALCSAEETLFNIQKSDMKKEANAEIVSLREQLFAAKDQLHTLRNSRVIGKIIKSRDYSFRQIGRAKRLPRKLFNITRSFLAENTPSEIKKPLLKFIRREHIAASKTIKTVKNVRWNKNTPILTVVVPYYNLAGTIDDTIRSLRWQTFQGFEIIIVDDGSTDKKSIKKLEKIGKMNSDINIIHQLNQGVAAARNNGISRARGKYVVCLDSDDMLMPTYIEKAVLVFETDPDVSLFSSYMEMFGVRNEVFKHASYDPIAVYSDNMIITAAGFRKEAWESVGGYKSKIGYEDWEYWINLTEKGFWAKQVTEPIFKYRVAMQSRYVEDKEVHWENIKTIRSLHPKFKSLVRKIIYQNRGVFHTVSPETAFQNINKKSLYLHKDSDKKNTLIAIPWMTFGGAETLILNFCKEIEDSYNLHFVTGLKSENEWEYKFNTISQNIYHLPNLFKDEGLYLEFISNYINIHNIDIFHIVHTDFVFKMLPEIKRRHPNLKIIVTMFNDRVPNYFQPSADLAQYIDAYSTDNLATAKHYKQVLPSDKMLKTIPNGVDCFDVFSPALFDRESERKKLGLAKEEIAILFVGRLSEEKNPDVFLDAADKLLSSSDNQKLKFFIIGDGVLRQRLEKKIKNIGSDNIKYLGYQSDVARYLSAADVFILPSSIEGFPLSMLEAMAMRVVVIASAVGAVPDIIENSKDGFIISPGSTEEIVEIIPSLLSDKAKLNKIKNAARLKLENNYSNVILKVGYLNLYKDVLK